MSQQTDDENSSDIPGNTNWNNTDTLLLVLDTADSTVNNAFSEKAPIDKSMLLIGH